jgi:hypothetical protein
MTSQDIPADGLLCLWVTAAPDTVNRANGEEKGVLAIPLVDTRRIDDQISGQNAKSLGRTNATARGKPRPVTLLSETAR